MRTIERTDHLYKLVSVAVDADGHRCLECGESAADGKLLKFYSARGSRARDHSGLFCSVDCHDRYVGVKQ